jgi:hypothetical protein
MKEMTEKEAEYWDEYYTKNPSEIDPSNNGGFATESFKYRNVIGQVML